jgi:hypothetical protein
MRLSAQRVMAADGHLGVNAFCYLHGPVVWLDRPPTEITKSRGQLVNSLIEIRPGGNKVLSYLDIVAPDDTPSRRLYGEIIDSIDLVHERALPLWIQSNEVTFEFNVDPRLALGWREGLAALLRAAIAARMPGGAAAVTRRRARSLDAPLPDYRACLKRRRLRRPSAGGQTFHWATECRRGSL